MICFSNAKINIGLNIIKKRKDRFHNIESVFYPIPLCDIIEIKEKKCFLFTSSGIYLKEEGNLCVKAFELVAKEFNIRPVHIHLHKIIPIGSGLGGGSSNAAFVLIMLNRIFNLRITLSSLQKIALKIGSDCPFFIINKPRFVTGKGNRFSKSMLNLKDKYLIIVCPKISVSTELAYSKIHPLPSKNKLKNISETSFANWKNNVTNDFENVTFNQHPEVKHVKEKLLTYKPEFTLMSGTGGSVYAFFNKEIDLKNQFDDFFYWGSWL